LVPSNDLPGIGPRRVYRPEGAPPGQGSLKGKAIWQAFGSLEEVATAESVEIAERAKLPLNVADKVRERAREVGGGGKWQ